VKRKILYIVSTLKNTGPTNQLYNIIRFIDKNIFSPSILTLSPEPIDSRIEEFKQLGIKVDSLNLSRFAGIMRGNSKLREYVISNNPDIIHTQGFRPDVMSDKVLRDYNVINTIRNYPFDDYPMKFGNLKGKIMANRHIKAIGRSKNAVACSMSLSEIFYKKHSLKLNFIQNGVNRELYSVPSNEEKKEIREKLGIPQDKKVFISVGSLISRKDPLTLVKGFLASEAAGNNSLLFIIGEGPLKADIKNIAKDNNHVILKGQIANVSEYLKAADYFISVSLSEGLPNTVLEAMSSGLPVCLSQISPHMEILNYNNDAGLITNIKDYKMLSSNINKLLNKEYHRMSKAASDIIENHLSSKIMSQRYQRYYWEILK